MRYIISFLILCTNYYTISYGRVMRKEENNKLGAFGAYMLAIVTSVVSITLLFMKF